jgi:hypothetical protein
MSTRHRARRYRRGKTLAAGALALVSVIAVAFVAIGVLRSPVHTTVATKTAYVPPTCSAAGCAVVSLSRTVKPVTVFYGASCSGVHGKWFFNAVEGGPNDELHPSYSLNWSFGSDSTVARPDGRIDVTATSTTQVVLTLTNGRLSLTGSRQPKTHVVATGTLVVEVTGTATAPALKFTETGLVKAENALGLASPFTVNGQPLTVPIKTVQTLVGC